MFTRVINSLASLAGMAGSSSPLRGPGDPRPLQPPSLTPAYPPPDGHLTIIPEPELLTKHAELIGHIQQSLGLNADQTERLVTAPIRRVVAQIGNLPATQDKFYAGSGGLLRLALDTCLFTSRKAQNSEFSGLGHIERRRREAPRWRLACALAGLLVDLHRCATQFRVTESSGQVWSPVAETLTSFMARSNSDWAVITWRSAPETRQDMGWNMYFLDRILGQEVMTYLHQGDPDVLNQLQAVLSGQGDQDIGNLIHPIVEETRTRLIARDLASNPLRFSKRAIGTTLGPYFADAMRGLLHEGYWTVNTDASRVFVGAEGVFLIWPLAAKEFHQHMSALNVKGVPRDTHTLAEMLADAGLILPFGQGRDHASQIWPITLPSGREISALRLVSPDILWPDGAVPDAITVVVRRPTTLALDLPAISTRPAEANVSPTEPAAAPTPAKSTSRQPKQDADRDQQSLVLFGKPTSADDKLLAGVLAELPTSASEVLKKLIKDCRAGTANSRAFWHANEDGSIEVAESYFTRCGFDSKDILKTWAAAKVVTTGSTVRFVQSTRDKSLNVATLTKEIGQAILPRERNLFTATSVPDNHDIA